MTSKNNCFVFVWSFLLVIICLNFLQEISFFKIVCNYFRFRGHKAKIGSPFLLNYFKSPLIWPKYAKKILGQASAAPAHPFFHILNPPMAYA